MADPVLTREIYGNIGTLSKLVFYLLATLSIGCFAFGVYAKARYWKLGRAPRDRTDWGAALRAFCAAEMSSGADLVAEITGFDEEIRTADLLVTGEGRTDEQTAHGKLCAVLADKARAAGAKTILISGALHGDLGEVTHLFDAVFAAVQDVCSLEEALARGRENLPTTARSVGRVLAMGA